VTPAGEVAALAVEKPQTRPPDKNDPVRAAIARSLGTPPPLNIMDESNVEHATKALAKAEPPPLPEIRTVSAAEPSPVPPPPPNPVPAIGTAPASETMVAPPKPPAAEVKCPWTLHLAVVKGRTILTAQAGKDASFKVECDLLELKAPQGNIQATGNVKISSDALEGSSERLTVNLQEDQVSLEGRAALIARRQGENMEIKGERLSLRLVKTATVAADKSTASK
jgi:hypothetical protein